MDVKKSKYLAKLLRHDPEDLSMDDQGYVSVKDILKKLNISYGALYDIVTLDQKERYSFNKNKTKIRANQGHTLKLEINFRKADPDEVPFTLFHGTTTDKLSLIFEKGISKMDRHHVHLSDIRRTADQVAARRKNKRPCVISINTGMMLNDGHSFYISSNGVSLVNHVDPIYFTEIKL